MTAPTPERGDVSSEPTAEGLTEAEREDFKSNLRQNLGYRAFVIEDTMVGHVERILADRLAAATKYPEAERSFLSLEWERLAKSATVRAESAERERDDLRAALDRVKAELASEDAHAVLYGVTGTHPDNYGGVTKDEALECAGELLTRLRAAVEGDRS